MNQVELIDIIIAAKEKIPEDLIRKLAVILNQDPYQIRYRLNSKIPKIITQQTDRQKAEQIVSQFSDPGLIAFWVKDAEIHQPWHLFKANSLEFCGDNIIFKGRNSQIYKIESNNTFLILSGIIRTIEEKEMVNKFKKLNVTATLLTGGIPISKTVKETTTETNTQNEGFVRLLENNSIDRGVEIRQYNFNYACLGREMSLSSMFNFNLIIKKIKASFPEAIFDDRLKEIPQSNTSYAPLSGNLDVNCKLLYLYHQAIKGSSKHQ